MSRKSMALCLFGFVVVICPIIANSQDNPAQNQGSNKEKLVDMNFDLPIGYGSGYIEDDSDPPYNETDDVEFYNEVISVNNKTLIYVIDTSGSMGEFGGQFMTPDGDVMTGTLLEIAKIELKNSINALSEDFSFNIISFECPDNTAWMQNLVPATPEYKANATGWVNGLLAGGSTGTSQAVVRALSDKENFTIILLTDGAPNCGFGVIEHREKIKEANTQSAVIHTFGIRVNIPEFEGFLRGVASDSGGAYHPVN